MICRHFSEGCALFFVICGLWWMTLNFGWKSGHRSPNSGFHFRPRRLQSVPSARSSFSLALRPTYTSNQPIGHSRLAGEEAWRTPKSIMSFFFSSRSLNVGEPSKGESSGSMTAVLKSKWVSVRRHPVEAAYSGSGLAATGILLAVRSVFVGDPNLGHPLLIDTPFAAT